MLWAKEELFQYLLLEIPQLEIPGNYSSAPVSLPSLIPLDLLSLLTLHSSGALWLMKVRFKYLPSFHAFPLSPTAYDPWSSLSANMNLIESLPLARKMA